ncbi:MAG: DUF882 domain-containing protein [Pseudomonadota bacterium]
MALIPEAASAETRKLKLYFLHTGERAEITYKKNGRYISSGLKKINRFLRDWRRNEPTKMDPRLLDLIWEVYQETGSKKYIHVVSAYRSPATNKLLRKRGRGVAKKSQHTLGKAMDFFIPGVNLRKLRNIGLRKGLGGVGYYPKSGSPFVHMDTGRVRHWPKMSRKELVRVFPKGKTLHVPTDGKPLARYNQAKAEYERKIKGKNRIVVAKAEEIEKKPGLFAKLLGRDEDEEGAIGAVSAPRAVATTRQRAPKPETPTTTVTAPAPVPPAPEPVEPKPTPETLLAALPRNLVPVPVLAPRAPVPETVAETLTASLEADIPDRPVTPELPAPVPGVEIGQASLRPEDTLQPESSETQLALVVPVPAQRAAPEIVEQPVGANIAAISEPEPAATPISVAALSPAEIEDLRREVYAVIKEDIGNSNRLNLRNTSTFTVAGASETQATGPGNKLSLAPSLNLERLAINAIDRQTDQGLPIEPGVKTTASTAVPTLNPRENNTSVEVASLEPIEEGTRSAGRIALPAPNPTSVKANPEPTPESVETVANTIPIPVPAQRDVVLAKQQGTDIRNIRRLESLEPVSLEERILGKWALATDASISDIADIRPPAYARNIIRELPSTVLSRGFVQDEDGQLTDRFSGSSIEFLDFTKFN